MSDIYTLASEYILATGVYMEADSPEHEQAVIEAEAAYLVACRDLGWDHEQDTAHAEFCLKASPHEICGATIAASMRALARRAESELRHWVVWKNDEDTGQESPEDTTRELLGMPDKYSDPDSFWYAENE